MALQLEDGLGLSEVVDCGALSEGELPFLFLALLWRMQVLVALAVPQAAVLLTPPAWVRHSCLTE